MEPVIPLGRCEVSKRDRDQKNQAKRTSYFFILLITPLNPVGHRLFTNTSKVITHGKHRNIGNYILAPRVFLVDSQRRIFSGKCVAVQTLYLKIIRAQSVCSCLN